MDKFEKYLNEKQEWTNDVTEIYEEIQRMRKQLMRALKNIDINDTSGRQNKDMLKKALGNLQDATTNLDKVIL